MTVPAAWMYIVYRGGTKQKQGCWERVGLGDKMGKRLWVGGGTVWGGNTPPIYRYIFEPTSVFFIFFKIISFHKKGFFVLGGVKRVLVAGSAWAFCSLHLSSV